MTGQGQLITGVVVGAGAMYLLDPECGARRRSLLQERGVDVGHQLSDRLANRAGVLRVPGAGARAPGREGAGWSPRIRLILGAVGGLMAVKGLRTRGVGGEVLTALGTALLARAVSSTPPQPLVDLGSSGSSATVSTGFVEKGASVSTAPAQEEEVTSDASPPQHSTKSTKRRRSRR